MLKNTFFTERKLNGWKESGEKRRSDRKLNVEGRRKIG
jgi:hypothetical protein